MPSLDLSARGHKTNPPPPPQKKKKKKKNQDNGNVCNLNVWTTNPYNWEEILLLQFKILLEGIE